MTTQLDIQVPKAIALTCAADCGQEIARHQRSTARFTGHHTATERCVDAALHWHVICEPAEGMFYLSHERSKAGK